LRFAEYSTQTALYKRIRFQKGFIIPSFASVIKPAGRSKAVVGVDKKAKNETKERGKDGFGGMNWD